MKYPIFLVLIFLYLGVSAKVNKKSIVIDGIIEGKSALGDEVNIEYYKMYSVAFDGMYCRKENFKRNGNKFHIVIDNVLPTGYLRIKLNDKGGIYGRQTWDVLFVEAGDRVTMKLKNGKINFGGKDAMKYNCQIELNNTRPKTPVIPQVGDTDYYSHFFDNTILSFETQYSERLEILNQYKSNISRNTFAVLNMNIKYNKYYCTLVAFAGTFKFADSVAKPAIASAFYRYRNRVNLDTLIEQNANIISSTYSDFLFLKERLLLNFKAMSFRLDEMRSNSFDKLFGNIITKYNGMIRDRLLTLSLIQDLDTRMDSLDYYLPKALETIKDPLCTEILKPMLSRAIGQPAFNFKFQDTSGKIVSLLDLKGKVVMIDIWFTGCHNCVKLNQALSPVYKEFKDNPKVKFLSVSTDKSKNMFINSVKSGIYTHAGGINLYTNGSGSDDDFLKFYGIIGAPYLILMDKEGKNKKLTFKITSSDLRAYSEVIDEINLALLDNNQL